MKYLIMKVWKTGTVVISMLFTAVQIEKDVETHHFHRHTEVPRLSLGPSTERLLEQWDKTDRLMEAYLGK